MHACGHDGHTAILLGVAEIVNEHRHLLKGNVVFIFQPAEELLYGGRVMLDDGLFDQFPCDAIFAFHNGQPVDGFQGAIPDSQIKAFIDKLTGGQGGSTETAQLLELGEESLGLNDFGGAAQAFAHVLSIEPENEKAIAGMARVYFGLSGSDANETNIKLVWYYNNVRGLPQKKKIISRWRGYHGSGLMTGSLTGLELFHRKFDLPLGQVIHTEAPYYYRRADTGLTEAEFTAHCAAALEALIADPAASHVLNCGYGRGFSVLEVLDAVDRVTNMTIERRLEGRRAGDPAVLDGDGGVHDLAVGQQHAPARDGAGGHRASPRCRRQRRCHRRAVHQCSGRGCTGCVLVCRGRSP